MILGGGPNRIGQGIEFDYCCVHAVQGLAKDGYETMVNCNPRRSALTTTPVIGSTLNHSLSRMFCTSKKSSRSVSSFSSVDKLLKLANALEAGTPILGASPDAIDRAEDRERFQSLIASQAYTAEKRVARSEDEAQRVANEVGYPVVVRPSYVLGGRAMEVVPMMPTCGAT